MQAECDLSGAETMHWGNSEACCYVQVRASLAQGNIEAILDPAVRASHPNVDALWKVAEIALQSVEPRSKHRPTINEVVLELTGATALEGSASNDSSYGNFSSSAEIHGTQFLPWAR